MKSRGELFILRVMHGSSLHATTVLAAIRDGKAAIGADGQVTYDDLIVKHTARKVRTLANGNVLAGFAGSVADAITLFDHFEGILERTQSLERAVIEFAKRWRSDKILRRLEAFLMLLNRERIFLVTGAGDVIEPEEPLVAIGSGGPYALASARALFRHTALPADEIVKTSLQIAAEMCIYTNDRITLLTLP